MGPTLKRVPELVVRTTVTFAICVATSLKSAAEAFSELPVSTEQVALGDSVEQAR